MAEETQTTVENQSGKTSFESYLSNFNEVVNEFCLGYNKQLGEENPDEVESLNVFCDMLKVATQSVEKEMLGIYVTLDTDSKNLLNRHIDNTGVIKIQEGGVSVLRKSGPGRKLELILEIIKKVGLQIIELLQECFNLPKWIDKILKIIAKLFEVIDNVWPQILELLGINNRFLKNAERDLLEFHPKWKSLRSTINIKTDQP